LTYQGNDAPREAVGAALVVHPQFQTGVSTNMRSPEGRLAEAVGLALAIELDIKAAEVVLVKKRRPATLFGQGHVDRLAELVEENEINVVIVDGHLSPVQQRNLEKAWNAKVIDRTGLILEIFGARARTHEGRLQVELASLTYQRSRLVRSWTHLERQRGGFGFLGGPGESQIEMDRRLIGDRITKLKRELVEVKRTRDLHRGARKRVPYPVVALVGYTNAGKSTLFNRLTQSKVFAEDLLFATLDPTMRGVVLPSGKQIILSDTVGFISDLPTQLVAAFRATLEEVLEADVILHVRDRSHPDTEAQRADVEGVLTELGLSEMVDRGLTEVWNKIDLMDEEARADFARTQAEMPERVLPASAVTGEGVDGVLAALDEKLRKQRDVLALHVSPADGKRLAWLYQHGEVLEREDTEEDISLKVGLDPVNRARYEQIFS
jgi:GTP-binding protein HflX